MVQQNPSDIPWPLTSAPGRTPQESAGRLINVYAEPLSDPIKPTAPAKQVWRRAAGMSQFAPSAQAGYRGGLVVNNLSYETWAGQAATVDVNGNVTLLGAVNSFPGTKKVSIARNQASNPDVVGVDLDNGAFILNTSALANATLTLTLAGGLVAGDTISLQILNIATNLLPVSIVHTVAGGDTLTSIATAMTAQINASGPLQAAGFSATSAVATITMKQPGGASNQTQATCAFAGTGTETATFVPASGFLTGGSGVPGIVFTGAPIAYNGVGNLPQVNSVSFQDGYLFFTVANGQVFASVLNSLQVSPLTFVVIQSKSDVQLLRGIPFSGLMLFFTTGGLEVWQDAANPAPNFPYSRLVTLPYGLIQSNAIAGFETGFDNLLWVAQDFGVYQMQWGSLAPVKVSPPDLDRLIEAEVNAGHTLEAQVNSYGGKKFWSISMPGGTWEFNLSTQRWHERQSLNAAGGLFGRWRATGGHLAFGKWIMGDTQSGNLLFIDDTNFTENGAVQLFRMESGPVQNFPNQLRIARADFRMIMGQGFVMGNVITPVTGAAANPAGNVRLAVLGTSQLVTGDVVIITGIVGTTEANVTTTITVVDATHIDIPIPFVNAFVSGGRVTDITATQTEINPQVAISCSKDGGTTYDNPSVRAVGQQGQVQRQRATVKNRGQSGPVGVRWRIDATDPVYTAMLSATMSADPRDRG